VTLRDPYVDALSYLQLRALAGLRADAGAPGQAVSASGLAAKRQQLERLLLGIAAGLQNTG
jgi:phosphoenolpyruvate carboxylase